MGTRGLTAVVLGGVHRVAQYGQWDHYLSGQGETVMRFCKDNLVEPAGLERFREAVRRTRFIPPEELEANWSSLLDQYPHLSRDTGADILQLVLDGATDLRDSSNFANDSLFCEQAYCIDLDLRSVEIHQGFQTEPHLVGRYSSLLGRQGARDEYFPVRLLAEYRLDWLRDMDVSSTLVKLERMIYREDLLEEYTPEDVAEMEESGETDALAEYRELLELPDITNMNPIEVARTSLVVAKPDLGPLTRFQNQRVVR